MEANMTTNITNATALEDNMADTPWYYFLEAAIMVIVAIVGVGENMMVMKSAIHITRHTKQNIILSFGLSLCDFIICFVRIPSLVYMLFRQHQDSGHVVCEVWMISTTFFFIANFTTMTIGIQRLLIMYSLQSYRKYFTFKTAIIALLFLWLTVAVITVGSFKIFQFKTQLHNNQPACEVYSSLLNLNAPDFLFVRLSVIGILGLIPIMITAISFGTTVVKVYQAGLMRLDRLNDRADYTRVASVAIARVAVLVLFWAPFLLFCIVGPESPDNYFRLVRYFDYVFCCQSAVSPAITLQDTDFKDTLRRRRWLTRYCTPRHGGLQRRSSSTKGGRRNKHSNVTSAEMKTFKQTE